jgi:hypothetical protein
VSGNSQVSGNACVYGDAWVSGDARVYGNAKVSGNDQVYGDAQVSDIEQQIHFCWNVTKDIYTLYEGVMDKDLTKDQIVNALLGMHQIYELKFGKLFDMYNETLKDK